MPGRDVSGEWLDVVDENDTIVGRERRGVIHARGLMHRSAQVLVFNSEKALLLQKRSLSKDEFPGLWDSSAAGHLDPGEGYADCARRELAEELGIADAGRLERLFTMPASEDTGFEHCTVFRCFHEGPFTLQAEEVDAVRWVSPAEMDRLVDNPETTLTPAIRRIWRLLRKAA